ncbi:hypothetical protein BT96DRAFT_677091 [Gymnopus androsaceus JB14]|uniref:Uncharacterized protein n=1 Tax=Gymnopus androsaceus JB14 TaxID=1447944 RepID=A0A6A4HT79_9AGAR|nr:hypothetical protein BT96DRAFT_677091 [Gymnopus androsaceus JB14]
MLTKFSDPPALPAIRGDGVDLTALTLSLYTTHPFSVFPTEYSRDRLAQLGKTVLHLVVTEYLFKRKPLTDGQTIQTERDSILNEETILSWLDLYPTEKHHFLNQSNSLNERQNLYDFFLSYVGAVYLSNGYSARPILEDWIIKLISPSDQAVTARQVALEESSPHAPSSVDPPHYTPPLPHQTIIPPLTPPQRSSSVQMIDHLSTPPGSPIAGPSLNGRTTRFTSIAQILNQIAAQKHIPYNYEERAKGEDHTPVWVVHCLIDGQEKGCGRASKKRIAKENAAYQAIVKMGWMRDSEGDLELQMRELV